MPTPVTTIISRARKKLLEDTQTANGMWTDAELLDDLTAGVKDLHRSFKDNYQNYFFTLDETNVSLAANATTLTGVPADVMIVLGLEARDLATYRHLKFTPLDYMRQEFIDARGRSAAGASDPGQTIEIFYSITGAGAPVSAPVIYVAPTVTATVPLSLIYVPTLTLGSDNPIPGESDHALMCWTVAHAKSKVREDQTPDPDWLELYKTEGQKIGIAITPRQEQEIDRVEGYLEGEGEWWD